MNQDTNWQERETFTQRIAAALGGLGIESLSDFRVPGTEVTLDLLIPEMPRAAIEVTTAMSQERLDDLLRARDSFGGRLNLYVVAIGQRVLPAAFRESDLWTEETCVDPATETAENATTRVAQGIANSVNGIRRHMYRLRGIASPATTYAKRHLGAGAMPGRSLIRRSREGSTLGG